MIKLGMNFLTTSYCTDKGCACFKISCSRTSMSESIIFCFKMGALSLHQLSISTESSDIFLDESVSIIFRSSVFNLIGPSVLQAVWAKNSTKKKRIFIFIRFITN
jgi:hypothetical protein